MAADLFGLEQLTPRTNSRPEAAALVEVLKALRTHPAVAWAERMNTGAAKVGNRFIRFGWPGCPDVLGQLKDGRLLGVEVKAQAGRLRPEQALFLARIRCAAGWQLAAAWGWRCAGAATSGHRLTRQHTGGVGRGKSLHPPKWKPAVQPSNAKRTEKKCRGGGAQKSGARRNRKPRSSPRAEKSPH